MREAEDVVDEEQNVGTRSITEVFRNRQTRQGHTSTGSWRLVHLAVNEGHFRFGQVIGLDNAGFDHFVVEVVPFTGPLTHTGENRVTTVVFRDVVDQFHDQNCLTHAGTAEEADFSTF